MKTAVFFKLRNQFFSRLSKNMWIKTGYVSTDLLPHKIYSYTQLNEGLFVGRCRFCYINCPFLVKICSWIASHVPPLSLQVLEMICICYFFSVFFFFLIIDCRDWLLPRKLKLEHSNGRHWSGKYRLSVVQRGPEWVILRCSVGGKYKCYYDMEKF